MRDCYLETIAFWRVVVQHESEAGTLFVLEHGRVSIQVRRELLHAQVAEFRKLNRANDSWSMACFFLKLQFFFPLPVPFSDRWAWNW